jgi:hypothetical protein
VNGGNISGGLNGTSGSDIAPEENPKWRKKYNLQVEANNAVSDKLRALRKVTREAKEGILVRDKNLCDKIKEQAADMRKMRDVIKSMQTDDTIIDPEVVKIIQWLDKMDAASEAS